MTAGEGGACLDRRTMLGLCAAGAAGLAAGGCSQLFPKRLRPVPFGLSLAVTSPEGVRTAINLLELQLFARGDPKDSSWMYYTGTTTAVYGQAAIVDLGRRGSMFALLRTDHDHRWLNTAPLRAEDQIADPAAAEHYVEMGFGASWPLPRHPRQPPPWAEAPAESDPPTLYPTMVRFRDPRDPLSVEKVDPDDLAKSFGDGVALREISIHVREPEMAMAMARLGIKAPPPDIRTVLPWLDRLGGKFLNGNPAFSVDELGSQPLASVLRREDFLLKR